MKGREVVICFLTALLVASPDFPAAAPASNGPVLITDRIASGDVKLSQGDYTVPSDAVSYPLLGLEALDGPPQSGAASQIAAPGTAHPSKGRRKASSLQSASASPQLLVDYRSYAQSILKRLIASSAMPKDKQAMSAPVFDIVDARNFNCAVTPQLHIACTEGLMKEVVDDNSVNENMLAFVLAHELSHIVLNHRDRLGREERLRSSISTLSGVAGVALLFARSNYTHSGGTLTITATHGASNALMYSLVGGAYSSHKAQILLGPAWSRRDEDEADALGLALMNGAGYDVSAAVTFIQRTQQSIAAAQKQNATFEKEMQSSMIGGAILSAILSKGDIKAIAASTVFFGVDTYMEYRGDVYHHDTMARSATMGALIDKYYSQTMNVASLKNAAGTAPSEPLSSPNAGQRSLILALQHGDHENAVRQAFLTKGAAAAAVVCGAGAVVLNGEREICGIAFLISGKVAEGHRLITPVLVNPSSPPEYFDEVALANAAANDRAAAMEALDAGSLLYQDGRFYPSRMHILHDLGDADGLKQATADCMAKASTANKLACSQLNAAYQQNSGAKLSAIG